MVKVSFQVDQMKLDVFTDLEPGMDFFEAAPGRKV